MANYPTSRSSKGNVPRTPALGLKRGRFRFWPMLIVSAILFIAYQVSLVFHSYARDVAIPVERALAQVGAVKRCSYEDAGRGPDNRMPWYDAYFEIPGDKHQATEKIHAAFESVGLQMNDGPYPPNPQEDKFYSDSTSRSSRQSDLEQGSIAYSVAIYGSADNRDRICGDPVLYGNTAFNLTINLPEFKR